MNDVNANVNKNGLNLKTSYHDKEQPKNTE